MSAIASTSTAATENAFAQAIRAWRLSIGDDRVVAGGGCFAIDTSSFTGQIPVVLRPSRTSQVQDVVRIAQSFSIPIYPISTGHNWGYGTSVPVRSPAAICDLSSMDRILEFDRELGVVTLEPGVTQGQLSHYLHSQGLTFMVPVTGAGPSCSVLANALERGFGVTPVTDHCGAILSMKVVLPDGQIYQSYTRSFNTAGVAQAFKWGTGPYLDGLFSQSNLGIVVDASIALQQRPERTGALFFVLDSNCQVEAATGRVRDLLAEAGQNIGAINLMNRRRVEFMLHGSRKISGGAGPSGVSMPAGAWFGFGSVYGSRDHYRATSRLIKRRLAGGVRKIRIYDARDIRRLRWISVLAAKLGWPQMSALAGRLEAAYGIVAGIPSTFALPLAYAVSGCPKDAADLNPARDGCGLFWYAPIVPLRSGVPGRFLEFAEHTCAKHGFAAPITFTSLSPRCYASTIPLLFDRTSPEAERRARLCFEELYGKGLELGFMPYRVGAQFMPALAHNSGLVGQMVHSVKRALDRNQVLAPGRYSFD